MIKLNILNRIKGTFRGATSGFANPQQWFSDALNAGGTSYTGATVNRESALSISAVYACIRVLSESTSSLPLHVYKRTLEGKEKATGHPLYKVLHSIPNAEMSAMQMRESLLTNVLLYGNAYAQIIRNKASQVVGLYPISSDRVEMQRIDKQLIYKIEGAPREFYNRYDIFHLKGMSFDGIQGLSILKYGKQSMGLNLGVRQYGASLFENGGRPSGIIEYPGKLDDQGAKNLKASWNRQHQGLSNANKTAVLEEGAKFNPISIPPEDAQFIATYKLSIEDIARFYNVPLHMIAHLDRATFSNIENQALGFVVNTLRPWLVRIEQEITRSLIAPHEQGIYFAEHTVDGLLRGDSKSRNESYAVARNNGWMSANEIRRLENMDNLGPIGDIFLIPLNMSNADQLLEEESKELEEKQAVSKPQLREFRVNRSKNRLRIRNNFKKLFKNAAERIVKRETNDLKKAASKHLTTRSGDGFEKYLDKYYDKHAKYIDKTLKPVLSVYAKEIIEAASSEVGGKRVPKSERDKWINNYLDTFIKRHNGSSKGQLLKILKENPEELLEAINQRLDEWEDKRPDKITDRETVQSENYFAKGVFLLAGVTQLRWVASGDACPLCEELNGQVVGIEQSFLSSGDTVKGEGSNDLVSGGNVSYAPLHKGCVCSVVPD